MRRHDNRSAGSRACGYSLKNQYADADAHGVTAAALAATRRDVTGRGHGKGSSGRLTKQVQMPTTEFHQGVHVVQ